MILKLSINKRVFVVENLIMIFLLLSCFLLSYWLVESDRKIQNQNETIKELMHIEEVYKDAVFRLLDVHYDHVVLVRGNAIGVAERMGIPLEVVHEYISHREGFLINFARNTGSSV